MTGCSAEQQCYNRSSLQHKAELLDRVVETQRNHPQFIQTFNECGNSTLCLIPKYGRLSYKEKESIMRLSSALLQADISTLLKTEHLIALPTCTNFNSRHRKYYLIAKNSDVRINEELKAVSVTIQDTIRSHILIEADF